MVDDRLCDIDCVLFYNGKCVAACGTNQIKVDLICFDAQKECRADQVLGLSGTCQ